MALSKIEMCRLYVVVLLFLLIEMVDFSYCKASEPPRFLTEPQSQVVKRGSLVTLECLVTPPEARISWYRYNVAVPVQDPSTDYTVQGPQGSRLVIESFSTTKEGGSHSGQYHCKASTQAGDIVSTSALLQVAYIKEFSSELEPVSYAYAGDTALIKCSPPPSLPSSVMSFKFKGNWIDLSLDRYNMMPSGSLQIANVSRAADKGNYKCSAINPVTGRRVTSHNSTKLVVIKKDDSTHADQPANIVFTSKPTVKVGKDAVLECLASGKPFPQITWTKAGGDIALNRSYGILGNLVIEDAHLEDAGTYICMADNGVGQPFKQQVVLTVLEMPKIMKPPSDIVARLGAKVEFSCFYNDHSFTTNIEWLFNGLRIGDMSLKHTTLGEQLIVHDITEKELGMYQCMVTNKAGTTQASAALQIKVGFPEVLTPPDDVTVVAGETAFLACQVTGDPAPRVAWVLNNQPVSNSQETMVDDTGLTLFNVKETDAGEYSCVAENQFGQTTVSALLTVIVPTEMPKDTIVFMPKESTSISPELLQREEEFSSMLFKVEEKEKKRSTVPEAPSKPIISQVSETSVKVEWNLTSDGGSPITGFRVQYKGLSLGTGWRLAGTAIPGTGYYIVESLQTDNIYRFRVIAVNRHGDSQPSDQSFRFMMGYHMRTIKPYPPIPPNTSPRITNVTAISPYAIAVQWEYINNLDETKIDGFIIYHRKTDSDNDDDYQQFKVKGMNKVSHLLDNLEEETYYDIKMRAYNSGGNSRFGNVVIVETKPLIRPIPTPATSEAVPPLPTDPPSDREGDPLSPGGSQSGGSEMLYLILGVVLGVMVLVLIIFAAMCMWRARQINSGPNVAKPDTSWTHHKYYDPAYPSYPDDLYGGANHSANGSLKGGVVATADGRVFCHDVHGVVLSSQSDYQDSNEQILPNTGPSSQESSSLERVDLAGRYYTPPVAHHLLNNGDPRLPALPFANGGGHLTRSSHYGSGEDRMSGSGQYSGSNHYSSREDCSNSNCAHRPKQAKKNKRHKRADTSSSGNGSVTARVDDIHFSDPPPIIPPTFFTGIKPISKPTGV